MAITEYQGRPTDIPDTVSDLVKGFAILAGALAAGLPRDDMHALRGVIQNLSERTERIGWVESSDLLREAESAIDRRLLQPR